LNQIFPSLRKVSYIDKPYAIKAPKYETVHSHLGEELYTNVSVKLSDLELIILDFKHIT